MTRCFYSSSHNCTVCNKCIRMFTTRNSVSFDDGNSHTARGKKMIDIYIFFLKH